MNATPARGRCSINPPLRDGRLSWLSWLDSAPAGSWTSDLSITSLTPNHCTTKTTYWNKYSYSPSVNAIVWQSGTTDDIVDTLSSLFELVNTRSVYLHCLYDENSATTATTTANTTGVATTAERVSVNRPSTTQPAAAAATSLGLSHMPGFHHSVAVLPLTFRRCAVRITLLCLREKKSVAPLPFPRAVAP